MTTYSKGFIIGCKDATVFVYRATGDPKNPYEEAQRFLFKAYSELKDLFVAGLSIAPHSEDRIACALSNNSVYSLRLRKDSLYSADSEE